MSKGSTPTSKSSIKSFTLIELIVVIIIVGILAAIGLTQYSTIIEKSRFAEAKIRIGTMKQLSYEYYLTNGTLTGCSPDDLGVDNTCGPTSFFSYQRRSGFPAYIILDASRCTSGGKTPNTIRPYRWSAVFVPATGAVDWYCTYTDTGAPCFGLPAWW